MVEGAFKYILERERCEDAVGHLNSSTTLYKTS